MIIRDTVAIKSVGIYFKKENIELLGIKNNLEKQIKELEKQFIGIESIEIINKFEQIIKDLKLYIDNLNYYGEFFINLSNHDTDVISKTKKDLLNIGVINE